MMRFACCLAIGLVLVPYSKLYAVNISINGTESALTLEYHGDVHHDDDQINKASGRDAQPTTDIRLRELRLGLGGKFSDEVIYDVNYGINDSTLKWGWVEWLPSEFFSIVVGYEFVNEGGWDNFNWLYNTIVLNPYTENNLPLAGTANLVELRFKAGMMGQLAIQLADDVVNEEMATNDNGETVDSEGNATAPGLENLRFNERKEQPAMNLEYSGSFGGIEPLIQYGIYDRGHSNYLVVGLHVGLGQLDAFFDYVMDNRAYRGAYSGLPGSDEEKIYKHSAMTLDLTYRVAKVAPFLKFMTYDVEQPDDDSKGNGTGTGRAFEDNATIGMLGVKWLRGTEFEPYLAVIHSSGKFLKSDDSSETESKSGLEINLGVTGKI